MTPHIEPQEVGYENVGIEKGSGAPLFLVTCSLKALYWGRDCNVGVKDYGAEQTR